MTRASSLPPDYTIRQARNIDIPAIYQIILMSLSSLKSLIIFVIFLIISIFLFLYTICLIIGNCSISFQDFLISLVRIPLIVSSSILITSSLQLASIFNRKDSSIVLLIEHKNCLVAYAIQSKKGSYSLLKSLYVKPDYRRLGLGSCLVQNLARRGVRPIYVFPTPESLRFYGHHGFTLIQEQNLPNELRRSSRCLGLI
ncbi:MAG: GNAT family N-acetyltransferase [Nostoc sp. DedVER02]|uniref:GNAT family N-acetyltransferase n=1 Tax=unclassified Nostoc TaxID=2593658 RepID=UPI002AD2B064|nr:MULTISPECIES: GNAT family N-acetyltransferase [unclassified Nostoc]MDZ7984988.1 GNAT family N-acetyltransferase [Nostoc sp. DedVER02]MDZ8114124.1 GNAT family N-acetyltransferase [Nostoc sp. DedVER01b]